VPVPLRHTVSSLKARISRSQPGQKLGLLGGKLLWQQNALLVQVSQPFDLGENVTLLGSRGAGGLGLWYRGGRQVRFRRVAGLETMGNCEMLTVTCWLVKVSEPPLPCC
jgi:hypothetical protein